MKNRFKILGILVVAALLTFSFTACDNYDMRAIAGDLMSGGGGGGGTTVDTNYPARLRVDNFFDTSTAGGKARELAWTTNSYTFGQESTVTTGDVVIGSYEKMGDHLLINIRVKLDDDWVDHSVDGGTHPPTIRTFSFYDTWGGGRNVVGTITVTFTFVDSVTGVSGWAITFSSAVAP